MDNNYEKDYSIEIDEQKKLALENRKINKYNEKNSIRHEQAPSIIPRISTKDNDADIAEIMKTIENKSLQRQTAKKKKIRLYIKAITGVAVASILIVTGLESGKKIKQHIANEKELDQAVEYMEDNFIPYVFEKSGMKVTGYKGNNEPIYEYDNASLENAVGILIRFGLTRDQSILLINKVLDEKAYSEDYFRHLGYVTGDQMDQYSIFNSPTRTFENMNQEGLVRNVKVISSTANGHEYDYIIQVNNEIEEGMHNARS